MRLLKIAPKRFSTRLIAMTLISGLIPIMIFGLLLSIFATRFPVEINRVIRREREDEWRRSEAVLKQMAEDLIRQKALDVALQLDLYLQNHSDMTIEDLQKDPGFGELAVQPVGKTGYTAVQDSDTGVNRFHKNPAIVNLDLHSLAEKLPEFWSIIEASLGGKYSNGYYKWKEPDRGIREKFMYIAPFSEITADGVRLGVAATTYVDEFTRPVQAAQDVTHSTTHYLMATVHGLIKSFRSKAFLFMGLGIVLILILASLAGVFLSRALTQLRYATTAVNQGDFNVHVSSKMSGDVGELIRDFNQMVAQLATTTVRKERLEVSEKELQKANDELRKEITERKRMEQKLQVRAHEMEMLKDIAEKKTVDLAKAFNQLNAAKQDLESFNKAAVGREMRIIEIKREVNELLMELEREPKYRITDDSLRT